MGEKGKTKRAEMFNWTEERIASLVKLWNDGASAEIIATHFGMSRSAVIGKIYRLRKTSDQIRRDTPPTIHAGHGPRPVEKSRARITKPVTARVDRHAKMRDAKPKLVINGVTLILTPAWTEAQTYQIIDFWNNGLTAPLIAAKTGRSAKSIEAKIYKLISLGLCKRGSEKPIPIMPDKRFVVVGYKRSTDERKAKLRDYGQRAIDRMEAEQPGTGFPIESLRRKQCRWPTGGSAPQWLFCGNEIEDGVKSSYCAACRPRMYPSGAAQNTQVAA